MLQEAIMMNDGDEWRTFVHGLACEDRIRTLLLFFPHMTREDPTAPIDIPPWYDRIQRLPTHVKSLKARRGIDGRPVNGTVDMACAYRLFLLHGYHRLIICLYEEITVDRAGKSATALEYHTIIEVILTPATLEAMRGGVTVDQVREIRDDLAVYRFHPDTVEEARDRFHARTHALRPLMGLAKPGIKLDSTNNRIQSTLSIDALRRFKLENEPVYEGLITQPGYQEFTEHTPDFHGLRLPWRTWDELRIIRQVRGGSIGAVTNDLFRKAPRRRKAVDPHARYVDTGRPARQVPVPGGWIEAIGHDDDKWTMAPKGDAAFAARVATAFRAQRAVWIEAASSWLGDRQQVRDAVAELRRLPDAEGDSVITPCPGNGKLREIMTDEGVIRILELDWDNYALLDQGDKALADLISRTCAMHAVGKVNHYKGKVTMLIPVDPPELIERVARAIIAQAYAA